ncbi:unnamed protein product [Didymodactylos carnosus]|uniref:Uncharacterized protein n=1 Tax=Didymodactylos carnosus TaxID=1234261 RepID=A0A814ZFY8_9BILA|nr:unnamed protein product [Didymodactylos carnosus]CAF1242563.1 unnamed protein product [Didymodactylos carnosus]CAF4006333.1 unnamed protein product [Didymodactylos carnosus]CAF4025841.1 unnamed protein product [Didymodactylos carnosus]
MQPGIPTAGNGQVMITEAQLADIANRAHAEAKIVGAATAPLTVVFIAIVTLAASVAVVLSLIPVYVPNPASGPHLVATRRPTDVVTTARPTRHSTIRRVTTRKTSVVPATAETDVTGDGSVTTIASEEAQYAADEPSGILT